MLLPKFDLVKVIEEYNRQHSPTFPITSHFDCIYFKELELVNAAIQFINEASTLERFTEDEQQYHAHKQLQIEKFRNKTTIGKPKANQDLEEAIKAKRSYYQWLKDWKRQLNDASFWGLITKTKSVDTKYQEKLYQSWIQQRDLSGCPVEVLIEIADEILPSLVSYFVKVSKNFKKSTRKVPPEIRIAYNAYVQVFLEKTLAVEQSLVHAMLTQLQAYEESKGQNVNSIEYLLHELHVSALGGTFNLPIRSPLQETLSPEQFLYYHDYIQRLGAASPKRSLAQLHWVLQGIFTLKNTSVGYQLIPNILSDWIPSKPGFLEIFNHGTNYRLSFFKDKAILFAALSQLPDIDRLKVPIKEVTGLDGIIDQLKQDYHLVETHQQNIAHEGKQFSRIFHRKTHRFLYQWQAWLQEQNTTIIDKQINLATKLVSTLNLQNEKQESLEVANAIQYWKQGELARDLLVNLASMPLNISQNRQYQLLKSHWERFTTAHSGFSLLQKLSKQGLKDDELQTLTQYLENLYHYNQGAYQAFLDAAKPEITNCIKQFEANLKKHPFQQISLVDAEHNLKKQFQLFRFLEQLPGKVVHEPLTLALDKKLSKYFLRYFECMQALAEAGSQRELDPRSVVYTALHTYCSHLEMYLTMLVNLDGRVCIFANKKPLDVLQRMQKLREEHKWRTLKVEAKSALETLLSEERLIERRFDKEVALLENRVSEQLRQIPELNYQETELNTIKKTTHLLVKQQSLEVNTIVSQLTPYEKRVIGYQDVQNSEVLPLIRACVQAQLSQQKMNDPNLSCYDKTKLVRLLGQQLTQTLHQNNLSKTNAHLTETPSGKPLFSKTYLKEDIALPQFTLTKTHS